MQRIKMEKDKAIEVVKKYLNCVKCSDCSNGCDVCPYNYDIDEYVEAIKILVEAVK